jgi:arabinan endo-1,5-alpha-L-arabinosidase
MVEDCDAAKYLSICILLPLQNVPANYFGWPGTMGAAASHCIMCSNMQFILKKCGAYKCQSVLYLNAQLKSILMNRRYNYNAILYCLFVCSLLLAATPSCNKRSSLSKSNTTAPDTLTYQNPVFNHDFPDPNLVDGRDGFFYAYSTNSNWTRDSMGGPFTIPVLRSKNLVNWTYVGDALRKKPDWKTEGGIWAPDASFYNNTYYLYYSFSTWGDADPGVGVATSSSAAGPFTDHGKLFLSKEIGVPNSIDPVVYEDGGIPYLIWGSFHGIYAVQLSSDGLKILGEKFRIAGDHYEGSFIYRKNGYYYYFGSTGTCCEGATSTYQVKVARATNFKGPYIDKTGKPLLDNGGTMILQKNPGTEGFTGPGHNGDIIEDNRGQTWMVYHAFDKKQPTRRVMLLDQVRWVDGWPEIEQSVPGLQRQAGPALP